MRPTAIISWAIIAVIAIGLPVRMHLSQRTSGPGDHASGPDVQFQIQGRYALGAARTIPEHGPQMIRQVEEIAGRPEQKIAVAILAGEVMGADAAVSRLRAIGDPEAESIAQLYADPHSAMPAPEFAETHPWFFQLARLNHRPPLDPERTAVLAGADRAFRVMFIVFMSILFCCALGLALLLTGIILLATKGASFRTTAPAGPAHMYVEAVALYLLLYIGASIAISVLLPGASLLLRVVPLVAVVMFAASWPLIRGVSWADYTRDIGWHTGRGWFMEIGAGVLGYLASLPLLAVGFFISFGLMRLSGEQPTHPIINEFQRVSPWVLLLIVSVLAPLTEELMFRGVLVSHMRAGVGIFLCAAISGLIFAAIHPQGWVLIPVLGSMGFALAIIRQWRDSLIASITAHAIHNGIVVCIALALLR
ncbi:MAG: CPBP family intramembrane metalloprotease [Burkholderiales bacterium]|nr:CPBP family intramembrane metalloprotease [Phycisphaerae bacterium]